MYFSSFYATTGVKQAPEALADALRNARALVERVVQAGDNVVQHTLRNVFLSSIFCLKRFFLYIIFSLKQQLQRI